MRESTLGKSTTIKTVKRMEVHPLCSRKRALSKIISSPTYQKRSKKENHPPPQKKTKKKEESISSKFDYLKRKERYGDNLLLKKKKDGIPKKKTLTETQSSCVQVTSEQENKDGMKTPFRIEKKEHIHPLCSRQRSLSKIVASPSYQPPKRLSRTSTSSLYNIPQRSLSKLPQRTPAEKRRYTIMPSLRVPENLCNVSPITSPVYTSTIRKSIMKDRRRTTFASSKMEEDVSFCLDGRGASKDVMNSTEKESCVMTPWKNKEMSMRERLDLWLASKSKPLTPYQPKYQKSPHPNRKLKNATNLGKLAEENLNGSIEEHPLISSEENSSVISKELEIIVEKFENKVERGEIERELDNMICKYTTIVKFADYWICKARLASLDDDVQRVICLLEQAHTFQAQPGDKIKEEICRYLECLEANEKNGNIDSAQEKQIGEDKERLLSLYAITPGRRVHFAASESPVDFKSSVIRFCLLESKAFKRRLKAQLNRKVITPVRRSLRVERSDLPDFLRTDNRVVGSPGEVECDIIDGEISFVPNKSINTPLNNGWLIQDENNVDHVENEIKSIQFEEETKINSVEETKINGGDEIKSKYSEDVTFIDRGITSCVQSEYIPNDVGIVHDVTDHVLETSSIQIHEKFEDIELSFM